MALLFDLGMTKDWTDKSLNESAGIGPIREYASPEFCSGANWNIEVIFLQASPIIQLSEVSVLLF